MKTTELNLAWQLSEVSCMFSLSDPRYQLGKWRGSRRLEMGGAGEIEEQEELQPSLQTFQVRNFSRQGLLVTIVFFFALHGVKMSV